MKHENEQPPMATEAARTLRELGIPGALATELESTLRMLGATEGDRVVGFTFVTPDGKRHALRAEAQPPTAHDEAA